MSYSFKNNKQIEIIKEMQKVGDTYEINGVDLDKAFFFYRKYQETFQTIPLGSYEILKDSNNAYLKINDTTLLSEAIEFQVCYVFESKSSQYIDPFPDLTILQKKYNELQQDYINMIKVLNNTNIFGDTLKMFYVLPELNNNEVWVRTTDGFRGFNIGDLEENVKTVIAQIIAEGDKQVNRVAGAFDTEVNKGKVEITDHTNTEIDRINTSTDLGTKTNCEDTIAKLQASSKYKLGDVVEVLGYYTSGDGAGHARIKKPVGYNGADAVIGTDGSIWGVVVPSEISVKCFGAKGDGVTDDTESILKAIDFCSEQTTLFFPAGVFLITKPLYLYSYTFIRGEGGWSQIKKNTTTGGEGEFSNIDAFFIVKKKVVDSSTTVYDVKIDDIQCISDDKNNDRYGIYAKEYFAKYHINRFRTKNVAHGFRIIKGTWLSYLGFCTFGDVKTGVVIETTLASTTMKLEEVYVMGATDKAYSLAGGYFECNNLASDYATGTNYEFRFAQGVVNGLGIESSNCSKGIVINQSNMNINSAKVLNVSNPSSTILDINNSNVIFDNSIFDGGVGKLYDIRNNSRVDFNNCKSGIFSNKSTFDTTSNRSVISLDDKNGNGGMFEGYDELGIIGASHFKTSENFDSTFRNPISIVGFTHRGLSKSYTGRDLQYHNKFKEHTRVLVDDPLNCGYDSLTVTSTLDEIPCVGTLIEQVSGGGGTIRTFSATSLETSRTAEFNLYVNKNDFVIINNVTFQITAVDYVQKRISLYKGDWTGLDVLSKPIKIQAGGATPTTQTVASAIIQGGSSDMRPKFDLRIGTQFFDLTLNKPIWWNGANWVDFNGVNASTTLYTTLDTPYHATKMQQEGILDEYYQYLDDKNAYDLQQRELEVQRQLTFENRENQEQTYEEWLAEQPMMLPVETEPQPSEKVLDFAKRYLG